MKIQLDKVPLKKVQVQDTGSVKVFEGYDDDLEPRWSGVGGQYVLIVPCPNKATANALKDLIKGLCADERCKWRSMR